MKNGKGAADLEDYQKTIKKGVVDINAIALQR